jgi:hypothetical protein
MPRKDMLRSGLAWLTKQQADHASRPVTYHRGARSASVRAMIESRLLRLGDEMGGTTIVRTDASFVIPASDLVLDGEPIEPRRGDLIFVPDESGSGRNIYEVMRYGGEPEFHYTDPHRTQLRVHTKHVEHERDD